MGIEWCLQQMRRVDIYISQFFQVELMNFYIHDTAGWLTRATALNVCCVSKDCTSNSEYLIWVQDNCFPLWLHLCISACRHATKMRFMECDSLKDASNLCIYLCFMGMIFAGENVYTMRWVIRYLTFRKTKGALILYKSIWMALMRVDNKRFEQICVTIKCLHLIWTISIQSAKHKCEGANTTASTYYTFW